MVSEDADGCKPDTVGAAKAASGRKREEWRALEDSNL